jgi:hypothetical protein
MPIISKEKRVLLEAAITEAFRFSKFAKLALNRDDKETETFFMTREMGQAKRASLDLSQALVKFRRG